MGMTTMSMEEWNNFGRIDGYTGQRIKVKVRNAIIILGSAAIGAYVGNAIGGPIGAAVGALVGTLIGTLIVNADRIKNIKSRLNPDGGIDIKFKMA